MELNILKERHVAFLAGLGYDDETLTKIDSAILNMNARVPAARLRKEGEEYAPQEELTMDNQKATVPAAPNQPWKPATPPNTPQTQPTPNPPWVPQDAPTWVPSDPPATPGSTGSPTETPEPTKKPEPEPVDPTTLPVPQTVPGVLPTPKTAPAPEAEPVDLDALADKVMTKMGYQPMFNQAGGMGQRPPQQQGPPQPAQPPAQPGQDGGELQQFMQQISEVIAQIMAEIQGLKAQMGGVVKEAAEVSQQLAKEQTPKLSFSEMLQKSIENQGTPLDGRSALVKDKPLETKTAPNAIAGSGFLGKIVQLGSVGPQ